MKKPMYILIQMRKKPGSVLGAECNFHMTDDVIEVHEFLNVHLYVDHIERRVFMLSNEILPEEPKREKKAYRRIRKDDQD